MTTASFKYAEDRKRPVYGTVTLKDDGKVSTSISNPSGYSYSSKYKAKILAKEIVKADFNHPAASNVKKTSELEKGLLAELLEKTSDFKKRFIDTVKTRAKYRFEFEEKEAKKTEIDWYNDFKIEYKINRYGDREIPSPVSYSREYYKMKQAKDKTISIVNGGFEKFEKEKVNNAIEHYEASTRKLAYRLSQKGFDTGFTISSVWLGVNIEMTIKKGDLSVRAWTIVAEGEIQQAHFRYLIK